MLNCQYCSNTFTRKSSLKRHMNRKHLSLVESDIERHMNRKHSVDSDIDSDIESDKMFDCDVCGALYRDQETLYDHISKSGEDKNEEEDEGDQTVWEDLVQAVRDKTRWDLSVKSTNVWRRRNVAKWCWKQS